MKQLLLEIEDDLAVKLQQVAPGRSRRSVFIRDAILRALWEIEEGATAEAYSRRPDSATGNFFDSSLWEEQDAPRRTGSRRSTRR